jgi:hypothetical protein
MHKTLDARERRMLKGTSKSTKARYIRERNVYVKKEARKEIRAEKKAWTKYIKPKPRRKRRDDLMPYF